MGYQRFVQRVIFRTFDRLLRGGSTHWLAVAERESPRKLRYIPLSLFQVDGRSYIIDIFASKRGWSSDVRVPGPGTLTSGHTDTHVTVTEVTDPAIKLRVVTAYATEGPKARLGDKREPESFLVRWGVAPDATPEGLAAAVPRVAVFEVAPTQLE